jgi:type IV pilus assembly protein PilC
VSEYVVRLGTPEGVVAVERYRASSAEGLRRELEGRGMHVFQVKIVRRRFRIPLLRRREKISSLDFLVFNQQFATLLRAGIPVLQSLELLQRSQASPYFREVLSRVLDDVKSGVALSESFAGQPELFPRIYTASLMAGERSGELVSVLDRFIRQQQLLEGVRRRVSQALTYPAVLVTLALGLIVLLMTYVIPRFATFYVGFAGDLPLPTKIVVGTASWLQAHAIPLAAGIALGVFLLRRWLRSERGRLARDRLVVRLPFVGLVFFLFALSQFVRALATLLAGGTPLVNALEIATSTVTNRAVSVPLGRVATRVREGQSLWSSLQATKLFPELSLAMVQVGEATGSLEGMLFNVSQFYDETIEVRLGRVVSLIEPVVLVFMGGIVASLLLSIYLPMFTLMQHTP